ncbi:hypothetical protein NXV08_00130 (plasmid) [Bacteroides fragilis]|nr:hypothetical protein [Bacteroides fragilis]
MEKTFTVRHLITHKRRMQVKESKKHHHDGRTGQHRPADRYKSPIAMISGNSARIVQGYRPSNPSRDKGSL